MMIFLILGLAVHAFQGLRVELLAGGCGGGGGGGGRFQKAGLLRYFGLCEGFQFWEGGELCSRVSGPLQPLNFRGNRMHSRIPNLNLDVPLGTTTETSQTCT